MHCDSETLQKFLKWDRKLIVRLIVCRRQSKVGNMFVNVHHVCVTASTKDVISATPPAKFFKL